MAGDKGTVAVPVLLSYNDETFSKTISAMEPRALMDTISNLQQEMKAEQDNFNSLSQQLDGLRDKRTQQYRQISKDLMASQSRLTLLMNRSMQCFSKQPSRTLERKAHQKNAVNQAKLSVPPSATTIIRQEPTVSQHSSNSVNSGSIHSGNRTASNQMNQVVGQTSTRVNLSVAEPTSVKHSTSNSVTGDHHKNHIQPNSRDSTSGKINSNMVMQNSHSSSSDDQVIPEHLPDNKLELKQMGNASRSDKESVKQEPKRVVYKIPQVSALRQTFEQKKTDDVPTKQRFVEKTLQKKEPTVHTNVNKSTTVGKPDQEKGASAVKSKQTYRTTVQVGSNPGVAVSAAKTVQFNGESSKASDIAAVSKIDNPPLKKVSNTEQVHKNIPVNDSRGVSKGQNQAGTPNHINSVALVTTKLNSVHVSNNQKSDVPVTSIDDIIIENSDLTQNSRQRSFSQPLHITSVVSKSHQEPSSTSSDTDMKPTGASLLEARLQRMRQGPMVSRSRPQPEAAPTLQGRMSLGGAGFGATGLGVRSSILERSSQERASLGPWNPFAKQKPVFGASSSIFKSHDSGPAVQKKYTPEAPVIEEVHVSSDLMRVRQLLKGKGFASVPAEEQPSQPPSISSRRESLMKRQPRVAASYSSVAGFTEEGPSFLSEERFANRPSFLSNLSTNGHVNGAEQGTYFSSHPSPLTSPVFPAASPTFSTSPSFPTSSYQSTFPTSPVESQMVQEDTPDFELMEKRRNIESQFEALGESMDSQTAGALDRISRVRKFLEESKRASEARLSVSAKDKYQISKKSILSEDTGNNEQVVSTSGPDQESVNHSYSSLGSTTEIVQSPSVDTFRSRFVRSPSEDYHRETLMAGSFQQSDGIDRFRYRSEDPRGDMRQDISSISSFPPRYVPVKQDVNHSETSLFRPIDAGGSLQRQASLTGSSEEPYVSQNNVQIDQSVSLLSHTLPRTKVSQKGGSVASKEASETKTPRYTGFDRPTKSTAAKAVPDTKPKPVKNPVKKTGKKLPQIAMFENMGQQNKPAEKQVKKGSRGKPADATRDKTVQKMLFGKSTASTGDQADGSDVISEDSRSMDSAEMVSISQRNNDVASVMKDGQEKGVKSGTPSPRSKTPRPHSRLGRSSQNDKSSRSSSSDKSGQFSPGARRKSLAESPSKSRSRKNSPERPRRKSISEQRSSNTPLVRRNSIRVADGMRVEDKGTVSSRNKMVDKARSRSKPDLRDISISRDDQSPSKPTFRRSKSVGKHEGFEETTEPKQNYTRKASLSSANMATKDSKAQIQNSSRSANSSESSLNSRSKTPSKLRKSDLVQKTVAKLNNASSTIKDTDTSRNLTENKQDSEKRPSGHPVGGWEFIYVGPKEKKSDDMKRFVDLSREIRGVELEPEDPDTIPVGPGVIRKVLDQFKRPQVPEENSSPSETSKPNDLLERVAQLKQSIKVGNKAGIGTFQESPELNNRHRQSSKSIDEGEVSEMGGAPLYRSPGFKLNLHELPNRSKQTDTGDDSWPTARSLDSESTDYDSAVEAQTESSTAQCVLSVEEDSMSEYNSAAETFGSEAEEYEAAPHLFAHGTEGKHNIISDIDPQENKTEEDLNQSDYNLIDFDEESTPVILTRSQSSVSASSDVDKLLFEFDPVPATPTIDPCLVQIGDFPIEADAEGSLLTLNSLSENGYQSHLLETENMSEENSSVGSSLLDLINPIEGEQRIVLDEHPSLFRQTEGYDNFGFGTDEENEQDTTMTEEVVDMVNLSTTTSHNEGGSKSDEAVELNSDMFPSDKHAAYPTASENDVEKDIKFDTLLPTEDTVVIISPSFNTEKNVEESPLIKLPEVCPSEQLDVKNPEVSNHDSLQPENTHLTDSNVSLVTNALTAMPDLEGSKDFEHQESTVQLSFNRQELCSQGDDTTIVKTNETFNVGSLEETNNRVKTSVVDATSPEYYELLSGEIISPPPIGIPQECVEQESDVNEVFVNTLSESSVAHKGRMCSTETEGGSSDPERDRLQSESDTTDLSEAKGGARCSSSDQAQGSGRKKHHRSESKKRRKRRHIEKAAAMRESVTVTRTQSEPSSPQQLKRSGSARRSGRKAKGAILMTNLLVLDMGLSDPGPDTFGEPGAVFLPMKKALSESEESNFDDAGSIADDESDTYFAGCQNADESVSVDTDDQAYLTPEAVSPDCEIPEPDFVKNNIFVLQDEGSKNVKSFSSVNEEPISERDTTICAMFKCTLGLLTRRHTQEESLAEKSTAEHTSLKSSCTTNREKLHSSSYCSSEEYEHIEINDPVNPVPSVYSPTTLVNQPISNSNATNWHSPENQSIEETENVQDRSIISCAEQEPHVLGNSDRNEKKQSSCIIQQHADVNKTAGSTNIHLGEMKAEESDEQSDGESPLSPKLHRDRKQSFIFHNKFIQEDIQKSCPTHPSSPKILGRRRHRSLGAASLVTMSPTDDTAPVENDHCDNAGKRKLKLSTRFVKDNLFFANDKKKSKSVKTEASSTQTEGNPAGKMDEKSSTGSLSKVLKASFRKLTHSKSFRRSKPKSASSTQNLSVEHVVTEVQSQSGSMLSNLGTSTPCLIGESFDTCYTGAVSGAQDGTTVPIEEDQDVIQSRVHLTSWDPVKLLQEMYAVRIMDETTEDLSHRFISMEGVMEKLPMGKRKSTLLKTWKRRYFKAGDGWLHYYENNNYEKPCHSFQLMGGSIEVLDSRILGIDDGRGHYLMVRCPSPNDFENWRVSLESQTTDNVKAVHVRPVLHSPAHPTKKVVIIDIGSTSVRAGVLGKEASLPQVFFPTVVAKNTSTGECVVGIDAYRPEIRNKSTLYFPVRPSVKVDKGKSLPFNIDMRMLPFIFDKVFSDLKVDSKSYLVLLSTPQMLADKLKAEIMDVLTRRCGVQGVCIAPQALLAMYSYKATSGIIVDVGERIDILPISDGYIVEGGVTRQPFGGEKVSDSLNQSLTRLHYHFFSEAEKLIVRHVMEKTCYVPRIFDEEMKQFSGNPRSMTATVPLKHFGLPEGTYSEVTHGESRFRSAEGFFDTNFWGTDFPSLHKLVHKAIIECPMDNRREMCRSIFLSGGVTMLPGFAERLELEITKLVPAGLTIQVHASPQRYHASFVGGCTLAEQDLFQQTCISREDWLKNGVKELKKWHMPS